MKRLDKQKKIIVSHNRGQVFLNVGVIRESRFSSVGVVVALIVGGALAFLLSFMS